MSPTSCAPTLSVQDLIALGGVLVASGAWLVGALLLSSRRGYLARAQSWLKGLASGAGDQPDIAGTIAAA
jgi:hypothetical protein